MLVGEHYYFDKSIENELGHGAFGVVYKGYDQRDNNAVAVKEISKENLNMTNVERENEIIMLLKSINHENIVTHFHTEITDNYIFMVMEFCDYHDLESYYNKHKKVTRSDMNIILKQLANGLQVLHSNHIIHRDLKPKNILLHKNTNIEDPLMNDLTLKIADFRTSRFISNNTLATTSVGTPIYTAPEIYTQEEYDHKADVWSVGLITYQGLFGRLPEYLNRDRFSSYFNFWNDLHIRKKEPEIEFPFCWNLRNLLRKSLIRDAASRMPMDNLLNLIFRLTEEPVNNQNVKLSDNTVFIRDPSLLTAAKENNIDLVRTLLEKCADPNIKDDEGDTALHLVAKNKNDNKFLVELLLDYGADIDSRWYGDTCLMTAAYYNNIEVVRCLLQNGADINKKNIFGKNALHYAALNEKDNKLIIELLLNHGADIDSQDKYGYTCLMKATSNNNIELVRCLLQNNADINKKNSYGENALHYAAKNIEDNKLIIELLLKHGADIYSQEEDGSTCLMWAARNNNIEIVRCLLQNNADIKKQNNAGQTALQIAWSNGKDNKEIVELLLMHKKSKPNILTKFIDL